MKLKQNEDQTDEEGTGSKLSPSSQMVASQGVFVNDKNSAWLL